MCVCVCMMLTTLCLLHSCVDISTALHTGMSCGRAPIGHQHLLWEGGSTEWINLNLSMKCHVRFNYYLKPDLPCSRVFFLSKVSQTSIAVAFTAHAADCTYRPPPCLQFLFLHCPTPSPAFLAHTLTVGAFQWCMWHHRRPWQQERWLLLWMPGHRCAWMNGCILQTTGVLVAVRNGPLHLTFQQLCMIW